MVGRRPKQRDIAARNRQEIIAARLSRREMVKLGLLTAAGTLLLKGGLSARASSGDMPASPPTMPFVRPMPIPPIKQPVTLSPSPGLNPVVGEAARDPLQFFTRFPPQETYLVTTQAAVHEFHPDLGGGKTLIWGYDGLTPGPTIHARYRVPIIIRNMNHLPQTPDNTGFGLPQITTHLHNGHVGSESDGFPADFFPTKQFPDRLFKDFHYPNFPAGSTFTNTTPANYLTFNERETMSTLWLHDHRIDATAQNVYKGLQAFYLLFDDKDSGDETDTNPKAFRFPSGEFDVPIMFTDRLFDANGQLVFDLFNTDGILGDKVSVNGAIQPFFKLARRKYRLRLINTSASRFYEFFLSDGRPFYQTSSDGNVFFQPDTGDGIIRPGSVLRQSVRLSPAERADVIVDFSTSNIGDHIYLQNRLVQVDGRGPTQDIVAPGMLLVRFDIDRDAPDLSAPIPPPLRTVPIDTSVAVKTRVFEFNRDHGAWTVNGQFFDPNVAVASPVQGTAEIWVLRNGGGGWFHPIHIHMEEFIIISRNGRPPPTFENNRKDVAVLNPGEEVQILMHFRDAHGKYVMHCHNLLHEDHAMMIRFDVVPAHV